MRRFSIIFAILPWLIMVVILFPRLWFAAQDLRMIEVSPLGRDEGWYGGTLWGGWQTGAPIFFSTYGFLYSNIFWVVAKLFSFVFLITEQTMIVLSRGISLAAYLSLGIISYCWLFRKRGFLFALLYSLLLFIFSRDTDLIIRATSIQADLVNFLTVLLSFFFILQLADKFTIKSLIFAASSLGILMAVKFFGFLLFPLILLILILVKLNRKDNMKLVVKMTTIFKKLIPIITGITFTIILFEGIFPTRFSHGEIVGIAKIYQLFMFQFFFILLILLGILLKILKLFWLHRKIYFFLLATTLAILVFSLSFVFLSAKSLFQLSFLQYFIGNINQQQYLYSAIGDKLNTIFSEGLGIPLSILFISSSIYFISKLLLIRLVPDKGYLLSFVWSWYLIFFFIFLTYGFAQRYLYILYPAVTYVAVYTILGLYNFISNQKIRDNYVAKSLLALFVGILSLLSFQIIQYQATLITTQYYSCLECIPGVQAGRWLDKEFSDNKTRILQETSVYVPDRFANLVFFPWGDPYPTFTSQNPDVIFLTGSHVRSVLALQDNDIDLMYRVPAGKPKKFISDLYFHKLPYHKSEIFGNEKDGNDIIVFVKDEFQIK